MEKDARLKDILTQTTEAASENFTANILQKIQALPLVTPYQPLVSEKIKKVFVIIFAAVVAMIFIVCFLIEASKINFFNNITLPQLPENISLKIFWFVCCFWLMFALNYLIAKTNLSSYKF